MPIWLFFFPSSSSCGIVYSLSGCGWTLRLCGQHRIYFSFIRWCVSFFQGMLLWRTLCLALSGTFRLSISLELVVGIRPSSTLGVRMLCSGLRNRAFCMRFRVDKFAKDFSFGVLGPVVYVEACCAALCPLSEQVSLILVSQYSIRVHWNMYIRKTRSPYSQYWQSSIY